MSLRNSEFTYFELQNADRLTYCSEVDRLVKEVDGPTYAPKRQKLTHASACGTQDTAPVESESGTIISLLLENFLCHEHLEVDFNRINFIVGKNGAGKSAILSALTIIFGGTAKDTGRGTNLKAFIRNGATSAKITCTVRNSGQRKFKPNVYGSQITIIKTICSQSSGSVALKSEKGKTISTKKEDLHVLALSLGIQVENPICMLDQNASRDFLKKSTEENKYELFMRASELQTLNIMYANLLNEIRIIDQVLDAKGKQLQENSQYMNELEKKYEILKNVKEYRSEKAMLQHEHLWATTIEASEAVKRNMQQLKENDSEIERLQQQILGGKCEEEILQKQKDLHVQIDSVDEEEKVAKADLEKKKLEAHSIKIELQKATTQKQHQSQRIHEEEEGIKAFEIQITAQQQKMRPDHLELRSQQQDQAQRLQTKLEDLTSQMDMINRELSSSYALSHAEYDKFQSLSVKLRKMEEEHGKATQKIKNLEHQNSNLAVYADYMPALVKQIEIAVSNGSFRRKPIGPLGVYIKVKDPKWLVAIETALGSWLRGFAVDNVPDQILLEQIIKRVAGNSRKRPSIVCTKFQDKVYDTEQTRVLSNYPTILDMLEFSDPIAANMFLEVCQIEKTLLLETDELCHELLSEEREVPKNCIRAFTVRGDRYFPSPNYKTYCGKLKNATILQSSKELIFRSWRDKLNDLNKSMRLSKEEASGSKDKQDNLKQKIQKLTLDLKELQKEFLAVSEALEHLKDEAIPDINIVSTLKREMERKEELLAKMRLDHKELFSKEQDLECQLREMTEQVQAHMNHVHVIVKNREPLINKIVQYENQLRDLRSSQDVLKTSVKNALKRKDDLLIRKAELETDLHDRRHNAIRFENHLMEEYAEKEKPFESRSSTSREISSIEGDIKRIDRKLNGFNCILEGQEEEIDREYHMQKSMYDRTKQHISFLKDNAAYLAKARGLRWNLYHTQKSLMCAMASHQFQRVMKYRNIVASFDVDFNRKKLIIDAAPRDGQDTAGPSTSCMSGGEKSFTTMAFVIALWNVCSLPFYFTDEFDVFMVRTKTDQFKDDVSRETVLSLLLRFAKLKKGCQFGFLTPLDTSFGCEGDDVSILKLEDPRK